MVVGKLRTVQITVQVYIFFEEDNFVYFTCNRELLEPFLIP